MSPETEGYLDKARECLGYALANLQAGLGNDAGRNAYLAEFHAAKAYIFEHTGKAAKTHHGVHTEFSRLAVREPAIADEFRRILPQTYNLKAVADYETGPDSIIPLDRAAAAVEAQNTLSNALRASCSAPFRKGKLMSRLDLETTDTLLKVAPADGRELAAPLEWFPRLRDATPEQRRNWRLIVGGQGIHWPEVDEDIAISTLLRMH